MILWPFKSAAPVARMKQILVKASSCYEEGKSRRAADLAHRGLVWFALQTEGQAKTPEIRRLSSDLAALGAFAHGRLERFQVAELWARQSVQRDGTNPLAYEALGLGLAMNGHTDDARAKFMEGLRLARESHPADTEAEERINRQLLWLSKNESAINELYQRKQLEAKQTEENRSVKDVWAVWRDVSHLPPPIS